MKPAPNRPSSPEQRSAIDEGPWAWNAEVADTWRRLAMHLLEQDLLRVWRREGYASMVEFAEQRLGVPPQRTVELVRIAKKLLDLRLVDSALYHGCITWEHVLVLARVAVPKHEVAWLRAAIFRPLEELISMVERSAEGWGPPIPTDRTSIDDVDAGCAQVDPQHAASGHLPPHAEHLGASASPGRADRSFQLPSAGFVRRSFAPNVRRSRRPPPSTL